ncbi:Lar family restriction alleviation protein [Methylorubrum rhodinum]|uniref:Lar family restriction alleviation protein n=1 Tax=Methylorubrum rhodinum TaxID=29428 RepID=UPI003BAEA7A5
MARIPKAKPCPFCRSNDVFVENMDGVEYRVWCNSCAAMGPPVEHGDYGDGRELETRDAIRAWNKRTGKRAITEGVAR